MRPITEQRGLATWEQLAAYSAGEWFPSRIAFGQHKGRSIAEARTDAGLRRWLDGLAQSANARDARMGRWYLRSLEEAAEPSRFVAWECASCPSSSLGTRLSAKLGFVGVDESAGAIPMETLGKQSFQDKAVTKQELGHEGAGRRRWRR